MPNDPYAMIIADCDTAVEAAKLSAYRARHNAIMRVLDGAEPWDEMQILGWFAGALLSGFASDRRADVRDDFITMMDRATALIDAADADDDDEEDMPAGATVNQGKVVSSGAQKRHELRCFSPPNQFIPKTISFSAKYVRFRTSAGRFLRL